LNYEQIFIGGRLLCAYDIFRLGYSVEILANSARNKLLHMTIWTCINYVKSFKGLRSDKRRHHGCR